MERIVRRVPQFVNVPKSDGFTALHLAAVNGAVKTATILIEIVSVHVYLNFYYYYYYYYYYTTTTFSFCLKVKVNAILETNAGFRS